MAAMNGFKYHGYLLFCEPMNMSNGLFAAQVTIQDHAGKSVLVRTFPALPYFRTKEEAVAHAKQYGERWVDAN